MPGFKPPEPFEFSKPEQWPAWSQRFSRFRIASKLDKEAFDVQVSSLIYAMGAEAEKVYSTFTITADTTFDAVVKLFDGHFTPQKNIIHERAVFHSRQQQPNENVEAFVRALYELAEHAGFGGDKDDAIRDRLVVGLRERELSEKLQFLPQLTLKDAIQQARQYELVKNQLTEQRQDQGHVDAIARRGVGHRGRGHRGGNSSGNSAHTRGGWQPARRGASSRNGRGHQYSPGGRGNEGRNATQCTRCGRKHGANDNCPARGKKCHNCNKMNHFSTCCRSNATANTVDEENTEYFLGSVDTNHAPWTTRLNLGGQDLTLEVKMSLSR